MRTLLVLIIISVIASVVFASDESTFKKKKMTLVPATHITLAGYPFELNEHFYFVKSVDRIFFQGVPVEAEIVDIDIDDNVAEFKLYNKKYGSGTIKIYSDYDLEDAADSVIDKALLNSLSNDVLYRVVLDPSTNIIHLPTCNHLPDKKDYLVIDDVSQKNENKLCGLCFEQQSYLPDFQIELSIQNKALAELRSYSEKLSDPNLQAKVDTIGSQVLKNWPYPLIGYDYKFFVIESKDINAVALPAGQIFITSGLIKSLENEGELEAVMAHEIAHIERRHSLQTYKEMVSNQQAQMVLQMIGGIAMGAAAASNHSNAAGVIGGVTLASMVAIQVKGIGFNIGQEKEADEYAVRYFRSNKKDTSPLKSVFKKLMYHNLRVRNNPDPKNVTHPLLKNRLADMDTSNTIFFKNTTYYSIKYDEPIEIKLFSIDTDKDKSAIVFEVSDLSAFEQMVRYKEFAFVNSNGPIECEIENFFFTNPWGGVVTVTTKSKNLKLDNLTAFTLTSKPSSSHRDSYLDVTERRLTKGTYY